MKPLQHWPENLITKTRWHRRPAKRVSSVLDSLGIPYRKVKGQDFWEANAQHLREIYSKFNEEAGRRLLDLHPDRTRAATDMEFAEMSNTIKATRKQFARAGVMGAVVVPESLAATELRRRRKRNRDREWAARWRKEVLPTKTEEEQAAYRAMNVRRAIEWQAANRARHNATVRRSAKKRRKAETARLKKWRSDNPAKWAAQQARRNARRRELRMRMASKELQLAA